MAKARPDNLPKDATGFAKAPLPPARKADAAGWQSMLETRRAKYRPECVMSGEDAVKLLNDGLQVERFTAAGGEALVYFLPKPDGRLRMLCASDDFDFDGQETLAAKIIARAVVGKMANPDVASVYWYIDDMLQKTGDGRIFHQAAQIIDAGHAETLKVQTKGDLSSIVWEVTRL